MVWRDARGWTYGPRHPDQRYGGFHISAALAAKAAVRLGYQVIEIEGALATDEEKAAVEMRAMIAGMSEGSRDKVRAAYDAIKNIERVYGEAGVAALSLRATEIAAEESRKMAA